MGGLSQWSLMLCVESLLRAAQLLMLPICNPTLDGFQGLHGESKILANSEPGSDSAEPSEDSARHKQKNRRGVSFVELALSVAVFVGTGASQKFSVVGASPLRLGGQVKVHFGSCGL